MDKVGVWGVAWDPCGAKKVCAVSAVSAISTPDRQLLVLWRDKSVRTKRSMRTKSSDWQLWVLWRYKKCANKAKYAE
jgi:hypothetical protein